MKDLVSVYRASNEATGSIVKAALEDAGILAILRPREVSWLDGALVPAEGCWGEVFVSARDAAKAEEVLAGYETGPATLEGDDEEVDEKHG